jgi:hypothetical protein
VGSTNRAGTVSGALELARDLVEATSRRLQEYLAPLLERLHTLTHGRAAARPGHLARDRTPRDAETAPRGGLDVSEQTTFGHGPPPAAVEGELPLAYGQSRAVLVARDPWWLFAHWEVPPVRRVEVLRALGVEGEGTREVLRVYEVAADSSASWDVDLEPGAERADVHVGRPDRTYRIEVGLRTPAGRFVCLVTSNQASTPPAAPSCDTTVHWVTVGHDGTTEDSVAGWSGRRVPVPSTATALEPTGQKDVIESPGSSESLPAGPRASDALPLR